MRHYLLFIIPLLLGLHALGQNDTVHVSFEIDGNTTDYETGVAKFLVNNDTIKVKIENGKLRIPTAALRKNLTTFILLDSFLFRFDSIPITINPKSPNWTLGIDNKPFDKYYSQIENPQKKSAIIYYLKNDDGRTFTVFDGPGKNTQRITLTGIAKNVKDGAVLLTGNSFYILDGVDKWDEKYYDKKVKVTGILKTEEHSKQSTDSIQVQERVGTWRIIKNPKWSLVFVPSPSLVGKKIEDVKNITLTDSTINLLVESAQFRTVKIAKLEAINCKIYVNENGVIDYISTGDHSFITPEGLRIGSKYISLKKFIVDKETQQFKWPGWGNIVMLPSGWNAVFDFNKPISPNSKIQFFFQSLRLVDAMETASKSQTP